MIVLNTKEQFVLFNRYLSCEMLRSSPRFSGDFTRISRLNKKRKNSVSLAQLNCLIKMDYAYVLHSMKDSQFYFGYTKNLKQRFDQHQKGNVDSTKNRRPLRLVYYEACIDKNDALKREKYFKTYHGRMYIQKRIKSYLTG